MFGMPRLGFGSLSVLGIALAGCGGGSSGGGGPVSTPPPAPAPNPAPSPAPSPTPEPAADLRTTSTVTFKPEATTQSASFSTGGQGPSGFAAGSGTLQLTYYRGEYNLTAGADSLRFTDANIFETSEGETTYRVVNGDTTNIIAVTQIGLSGITNRRNYRYLNAGYWTRVLSGSGGTNNSTSAFVFGLQTPPGAMPRAGSAGYRTEFFGTMAYAGEPEPLSMIGSGSLVADFATGALTLQGGIQLRRTNSFPIGVVGNYNASLTGAGAIASGENRFAGNLQLSGVADLTGNFSGRFFGPGLDEVGIAFSAVGPNASAAGTITGVPDLAIPTRPTLAGLVDTTRLSGSLSAIAYGAGARGSAPQARHVQANFVPVIEYSPATQTYTLTAVDGFFGYFGDDALVAGPSQRAATQDQAGFVLYNPNPQTRVAIYNGGSRNIQFTYASFAKVESTRAAVIDGVGSYITYVPFGLRTLPGQMPVTGRARYAGEIFGIANRTGYGADFTERLAYTLSGTSSFEVDFSTYRMTGSLTPVGMPIEGGPPHDFGVFTIDGSVGTLQYLAEARINGAPDAGLHGMFFGPSAQEFAAYFAMITPDQLHALKGITVAKRD